MSHSRKSDTPLLGEADKFRVNKVDTSHIERPQPSPIERSDTPLPGKPEDSIFGSPGNSLFGRSDTTLPGGSENSLFGRSENSLFRRPESSLFGRPENSLFGRPGNSLFGGPGNSLFGRPDNFLPGVTGARIENGTSTIVRTQEDIKEIQPIPHGISLLYNQPDHLKRNPRWTHPGPEPLTNPKDLPCGWNMNEPDLDPKDLEAQIKRCQERIEDNIMPHLFRARLKVYQEALEARQ